MTDTYVGAIDQGTTGTRFMVFDHGGQVVANAYEKHEQIYPEPGWVEHDPVEIWENTKTVVVRALDEADLEAEQLAAIGITNQRETTLVWDVETGDPVHNALVWQDRRTTDRVEELEAEDKVEWIRGKTGLEADAYFWRRKSSGSSTTPTRSSWRRVARRTSGTAPRPGSSGWAQSTRGSSRSSPGTSSPT